MPKLRHPTTSFRLDDALLTKLADLQGSLQGECAGPVRRAVTASDVVRFLIEQEYAKRFPAKTSGTGNNSRKKA